MYWWTWSEQEVSMVYRYPAAGPEHIGERFKIGLRDALLEVFIFIESHPTSSKDCVYS